MARSSVRSILIAASAALLAAAVVGLNVATAGPGPTSDTPLSAQQAVSSPYTFGLWGDMPYAKAGDNAKMPALIQSMNSVELSFSVFLGDIKDGSSQCTDDQFSNAIDRFSQFKAPMIYVPGDNEWTDCHRLNNGGYNNLERLDFMRKTMFARPESFGQLKLTPDHQAAPYVENTRWIYRDVVFVGLNVPGSNNNKVSSFEECTNLSARSEEDCNADNLEYQARDAANIAWLQQAFQIAKQRSLRGVMLIIQADPGFDLPETETFSERDLPQYDGYTAFLNAVVAETQAYSGQVVLVHGDTHFFKLDKPLINQANMLQNFTRLETFGSPNIHWVKVDVNPSNPLVFSFTPVFVPGN